MPDQHGRAVDHGADDTSDEILAIRDLSVSFRTRAGTARAVDRLSLSIKSGEVLGIVGESGSGKSVAMYSIMGLVRDPNATVQGSARFAGRELLSLGDDAMRRIRGREIAMIFQDPMTALTPVYRVGWQIAEQIREHTNASRRQARARAIELLAEVGIPDPHRRVDNYPHEFSGGMRQRVVIAMALSCNPRLLIADEPTTALDVTIQAQILALMRRLMELHGSSIILITHDMGVISEVADRVVVMYAGRAVEAGPRRQVLRDAQHPYTWGLLGAVPRAEARRRRLTTIPGSPVSPYAVPSGCAFAPRCTFRFDQCAQRPELVGPRDHRDACWLPRHERSSLRDRMIRTDAPRTDRLGPPGPATVSGREP